MKHKVADLDSAGFVLAVLRETGVPLPVSRERYTMKYKVADLEGALLDAAVAKAEGWVFCQFPGAPQGATSYWWEPIDQGSDGLRMEGRDRTPPPFSTSWTLGGPIIERERIAIWRQDGAWSAGVSDDSLGAMAHDSFAALNTHGAETPLVAAMRARVRAKLGDEVELP